MRSMIFILMIALLVTHISQGQGTVYLSNLGQASTAIYAVESNSWMAAMFHTGNNVNGYAFDSVQLAMTDAVGNANGFTAMLYSSISGTATLPGGNLDTLNGPDNPSTAGIYTYTSGSSLILAPHTYYFLVLDAGTAVANGAYEWGLSGVNSYNPNGGWAVTGGVSSGVFDSINGSTWNSLSGIYPQFAITAEPIPEPSSSLLFLLASGVFIYVRRTCHR